jgi:hypothetical protein
MQNIQGEMDKQIAKMLELREQIRTYQNSIDTLQHDYDKIGDELLDNMDLLGLKAARTDQATLSVSETTRPGVEDWIAFTSYVFENKALELLERRPAVKACLELNQLGTEIPGIYFFTKRKVNLRTL